MSNHNAHTRQTAHGTNTPQRSSHTRDDPEEQLTKPPLEQQKTDTHNLSVGIFCGARGIRTPDLFHALEARYQLRHSPVI